MQKRRETPSRNNRRSYFPVVDPSWLLHIQFFLPLLVRCRSCASVVPAAFISSSAACSASTAVSLVSDIVGICLLSRPRTALFGMLVLIARVDLFSFLLAFLYVAA